jgi:S-adenosylmethionine/arginine decarboxylase-like enzyme
MNSWGKHMILNLYKCKRGHIKNKCRIEDFSKVLVKRIDMKAYGAPQIVHFGEENKAGYTLVQLIETSNITGHFCDDSGNAYLDVFSCKDFSEKEVEKCVKEYFEPEGVQTYVFERQARPDYF